MGSARAIIAALSSLAEQTALPRKASLYACLMTREIMSCLLPDEFKCAKKSALQAYLLYNALILCHCRPF